MQVEVKYKSSLSSNIVLSVANNCMCLSYKYVCANLKLRSLLKTPYNWWQPSSETFINMPSEENNKKFKC